DVGQGRLRRLGLGHRELEGINPGLIYCSITAHGAKGPLRNQPASELTLQAMSDSWAWCDYLNVPGVPGKDPVRLGPDMASMGSSLYAALGVLGALYHKWRTGEGQHVTVNMLGTLLHQRTAIWPAMVDPDEWAGFYCEAFTRPPEYGYKTGDGYITMDGMKSQEQFRGLLKALGMEKYMEHPLFQNPPRDITGLFGAGDLTVKAKPIWEDAFQRWQGEDLVALLGSFGSTAAVANTYSQLLSHPQMEALDIVKEADHPQQGKVKFIVAPWRLQGLPGVTPHPYRALG
ncbi:MAG: CoA transferase, partial [Chloroflexi bacterium]|nr:CoA transferase [Chloroflexota bacterium]